MQVNKFSQFTADELYVIKRAFINGSFALYENDYPDDHLKLHDKLSNKVAEAIKAKKEEECKR